MTAIAVEKSLCEIAYMQPSEQNQLYSRLLAVKPAGLSFNAWAMKAGVSRTFFNDVRKRGNARHDSLLKILSAADVSLADFESGLVTVRTEVRGTGLTGEQVQVAARMPQAKPIPLLGTAFGGDWEEDVELTELHLSEVLDNLARPSALAADDEAYAIEIVGESMYPRYKPGERAYVSPRLQVRPGDDVVVQLTDPDAGGDLERRVTMVLIKELVRRSGSYYELRQFNPDKIFRVPADRVRRIHRVRGRP